MLKNYHTHTFRCKHAVGTEREYVEQAIRAGLKVLGFSDHTPYPFPGGYISNFRMGVDELDGYVNTVLELKREYAGEIEIPLGFETEYYPLLFDDYLRMISDYPIEYLLLGQHYLGNETGDAYSGQATASQKTLRRYCTQTAEALETGRFSCFAHPDLINYIGPDSIYESAVRPLCEKAKELSVPLEINLLGVAGRRCYPNYRFFRIAGEVGCDAILGSDAHAAEEVTRPEAEQQALLLAEECHLHLIDTLKLKNPCAS